MLYTGPQEAIALPISANAGQGLAPFRRFPFTEDFLTMPTEAQRTANSANALHSTGPKTAAGRAASARNHLSHGLAGSTFTVLAWEDQSAFGDLSARLELEHKPETITEEILIRKMAQHYWLTQRAIALQGTCFNSEIAPDDPEKQLALYLRYQTTHDRNFHKCLNDLLKLRAERRKAEIGFESQKMKQNRACQQAESQQNRSRQQAADQARKQELHKWKVLRAQAEVDHRILLNVNLQTPEHSISVGPQHIIAAEKAA